MYRAQQQYLPAALVVAGTGNNTFISFLFIPNGRPKYINDGVSTGEM